MMTSHVELEWIQQRPGAHEGKLGEHGIAYVFHDPTLRRWAWFVSQCNGVSPSSCQYSATLGEAKKEVNRAIAVWLEKAGLRML
jgi:hypothetical protein